MWNPVIRKEQVALILSVMLIVLSILSGISSSWADCKLSVGWEPWPPYLFLDENGELTGLDKEFITAVAKEANCTLTFRKLPWQRHLEDLKHGRIDIATSASKNQERMKYAYFSNAYRSEFVALFVRKGESEKYIIQSLKDIIKMPFKLGVTRGYYYGKQYEKLIMNPQFEKRIQKVTYAYQNYEKLIAKRVNGFLADKFSAAESLRKLNLTDRIEIHPMPIIPTGKIFFMFSKRSVAPETIQIFNDALATLRANGSSDKILKKYLIRNQNPPD